MLAMYIPSEDGVDMKESKVQSLCRMAYHWKQQFEALK